ncbi:LuxR C-terminal-related transcriptional regulator [Paenibacillus sp. MER TA 81-3]|nr:LuxR C-terminal-related transcriptional regulator [Paenibacillus sp. MER TA 81-3]
MNLNNKRVSKLDGLVLLVRILFFVWTLLLLKNEYLGSFLTIDAILFIVLYLQVPIILLAFRYQAYIIADVLITGGFSIYTAIDLGFYFMFFPAAFTMGYFHRNTKNWVVPMLAIATPPVAACFSPDASWGASVFGTLFLAACFYFIGFGLRKLGDIIRTAKRKLTVIGDHYEIIEQHPFQTERTLRLEERCQTARETTKKVCHLLTIAGSELDALRQHVTSVDGMKRLESLRASIVAERDQLHDQLRSLEQPGYDLPLEDFIEAVADDWSRQEGVPVSFRKLGSAYPVDQDTQQLLYRCAWEALANACWHGRAGSIHMTLQYAPTHITLQIEDNGKRLDWLPFGSDLSPVKERLNKLGGDMHLYAGVDGGTMMTVTVPSEAAAPVERIEIVVMGDSPAWREHVVNLLNEERDFRAIAADHEAQAGEVVKHAQPDIILLSVHWDGTDRRDWIGRIREKGKGTDTRVIVIVNEGEERIKAVQALRCAVDGYASQEAGAKELAATIRFVHCGGRMIPEGGHEPVGRHSGGALAPSVRVSGENPFSLTSREMDIMKGLMQGLRYKAIASRLHLSERTVRNYMPSIYAKLNVSNRDEAVEKARKESLIS